MINTNRLVGLIRLVSDAKTEANALSLPDSGGVLFSVQQELTKVLGDQLAKQELRKGAR